jgi:hypothetical protein
MQNGVLLGATPRYTRTQVGESKNSAGSLMSFVPFLGEGGSSIAFM